MTADIVFFRECIVQLTMCFLSIMMILDRKLKRIFAHVMEVQFTIVDTTAIV